MAEGAVLSLSTTAQWIGGELRGADGEFHGVCTDTRTLTPGCLFVALKGPRHDGHDHVAEAQARGAAAALVDHPLPSLDLPQLVSADTRIAIGALAAAWRRELSPAVVAVTGSNGKTTVKEMLAAICSQAGPTLATRGNLNNDIGVPLTLLGLEAGHRYAVIEMGANHPGEIDYLTSLARPDVAVVNNAAAAHLEGFGSVEGVARAKGEIFSGLGTDGTAVINADDPYASFWRELNGARRVLSFGFGPEADVTFDGDPGHGRFAARCGGRRIECALALLGRHNQANALAATACALALGLSEDAIAAGLGSVQPAKGRLQPRRGAGGARLVDDTYNANPASLRAAVTVLSAFPGRRVLVLGDMGELGEREAELHEEAGHAARAADIDALYAVGGLATRAAGAFGAGGRSFDDVDALIAALRPQLAEGVTLLVKGSRAARMERVVDALAEGR